MTVLLINRNNLNQMKKAIKKVPTLIVDQFQKIKKNPLQLNPKPSHSNHQHQSVNIKIEEVACKYCHKIIPEFSLMHHQKACVAKLQEEDYYDMFYQRPQHNGRQKQQKEEQSIRKQRINCNDDYYPQQDNPSNHINKSKRPMSAMNKKNQQKPKLQIKQIKLKKATSTTKLKDQSKKSQHVSKEKGDKNRPSSNYEHIYLKNIGTQKKNQLSIGNSKLKKKNANAAHRFINSQQRSIEQKPQRIPSHSKKEQRLRESYRFQEQDERSQKQTIRNKEQIRLDPQINTKKLKEMVHQKLKHDSHQQKQKKQQIRREQIHYPPQRQPIRTQTRINNEPQQQPRPPRPQRQARPNQRQRRQQIQNREDFRNPDFQRYPRRNQQRGYNGPNLMHLVSQTIHNQLQMMNNQFSMMSNMFQNFNSFVNINIESHPNYYHFTNQQLNTSSEYDSDSNSSHSSDSQYDDYYEEEEPQGMDDEQLNSIPNKKYRVAQHGNNQCTICLMELNNGDIIKKLFCDHMFHSECIEEWLRRKSACPVCRDQLGSS